VGRGLSFSRTSDRLAFGLATGEIVVSGLSGEVLTRHPAPTDAAIESIHFTDDGDVLATYVDGRVTLFTESEALPLELPGEVPFSVRVSGHASHYVLYTETTAVLRDTQGRQPGAITVGPGESVIGASLDRDGGPDGTVVTASEDGSVKIWNAEGVEVYRHRLVENLGMESVYLVARSPDGKWLVAAHGVPYEEDSARIDLLSLDLSQVMGIGQSTTEPSPLVKDLVW
jgi:WD40 repeat protein